MIVRAEARSHSVPFRDRIIRQIEQSFRRAAREVKSCAGQEGRVDFEGHLDYEAFRLKENDASLLTAEAALRASGARPSAWSPTVGWTRTGWWLTASPP